MTAEGIVQATEPVLLDATEEFGRRDAHLAGELDDVGQARVLLAAFDGADVGAVQPRFEAQRLLRKSLPVAGRRQIAAEGGVVG